MQQIKRYGKILTAVAMLAALALAACRKEPVDTAGKREFTAFSYLAVEADERLVTELSGDRLYYVRPETDGLTFTVTKKKILAIRLFSRLRRDFLLLCFFLYFL